MSVRPQKPWSEQQDPKVDPAQVWPDSDPHWPFLEMERLADGVLAAEDDVDELSETTVHELAESVTVVVTVTTPVNVSVTVWSVPMGPGRVSVDVSR